MSPQPTWMRRTACLALTAAMALWACDGLQEPERVPEQPEPELAAPRPMLASAVVSNPVMLPVGWAPGLNSGADGPVVYVSLPPGAVPGGERATLANPQTGAGVTIPMALDGFDPVSLAAGAGDTVNVDIQVAGADTTLRFSIVVPDRLPPVVVRTDPPPQKRDVPLNAVLLVVFSEPLAAGTLTDGSVRLLLDGVPVPGMLAFGDDAQLTVTFTPAKALAAGVQYTLLVTQAVKDLSGDALAAPLTTEFVTRLSFSGGAGIYVAAAAGTEPSWLAAGYRPSWSPDGRRIAFHRQGEVYIINADGSNEVLLTRGTDPAWSPDGERIVFADDQGISVITLGDSAIVRLIGLDFVDLGEPPQGLGKPAWSPDGGSIAFEHYGSDWTPVQIYVMNADGSVPRRLTDADDPLQCAESDPSWSADGSLVAYWSYCSGISLAAQDGGGYYSVYPGGYRDRSSPFVYSSRPSLSPDKETILASSRWWLGGADLFVMARDGTGARVLVPGGYHGAWSPDGRRIAFVHGLP